MDGVWAGAETASSVSFSGNGSLIASASPPASPLRADPKTTVANALESAALLVDLRATTGIARPEQVDIEKYLTVSGAPPLLHTHIHIHTYIYTHIYTHIHTRMQTQAHTYTPLLHTHIHTHAHSYTNTATHIQRYKCSSVVCIKAHTHMYMYADTSRHMACKSRCGSNLSMTCAMALTLPGGVV